MKKIIIKIIIGIILTLAVSILWPTCSNTNELRCARIEREATKIEKEGQVLQEKKYELIAKMNLIKFETEREALEIETRASVAKVRSLLKRCKELQAEAIKYNCP